MKKLFFKPTVNLANTTGDPDAPFDLVVLGGFANQEAATEFAQRLIGMGIVELPAPFEAANSKLVM